MATSGSRWQSRPGEPKQTKMKAQTNIKSSFKLGQINIRTTRAGKSSQILKRAGWIKLSPSAINNRNACNWVMSIRTEAEYLATDWTPLAAAGLEGVAFWISDYQWSHDAAPTAAQWSRRSVIEFVFNSVYPTGRRAAA